MAEVCRDGNKRRGECIQRETKQVRACVWIAWDGERWYLQLDGLRGLGFSWLMPKTQTVVADIDDPRIWWSWVLSIRKAVDYRCTAAGSGCWWSERRV